MVATPNKITDAMDIVVDANLLYKEKLQYIEIIVDKYHLLISYHGKYFYRFGSIMRTITGKELDKAILKSQGRIWDGMPIPKLQVTDLRREAMLAFYKDSEKWVTGSYIKIGTFGDSDSDLKYQDEVHGSLIEQIDKAVDLVYMKY